MGDEIDGAIQQAPQPTRHSIRQTACLRNGTHAMLQPITANTILYCADWAATVAFYRDRLGFPVTHANDWFVEFAPAPTARLSIADERRATVKSTRGQGITLTFQVDDACAVWTRCHAAGLNPTRCRDHTWGARVFYLRDPEGHRIEIWSPKSE